jgi:hypothetical protein
MNGSRTIIADLTRTVNRENGEFFYDENQWFHGEYA